MNHNWWRHPFKKSSFFWADWKWNFADRFQLLQHFDERFLSWKIFDFFPKISKSKKSHFFQKKMKISRISKNSKNFKNLRSKGRMRIRISFVQKRFPGWFRWCRPILIKTSSFNMRWRHRFPVCQIAISKCWNKIGNTCTKIFDKHMSNSRWAGFIRLLNNVISDESSW